MICLEIYTKFRNPWKQKGSPLQNLYNYHNVRITKDDAINFEFDYDGLTSKTNNEIRIKHIDINNIAFMNICRCITNSTKFNWKEGK